MNDLTANPSEQETDEAMGARLEILEPGGDGSVMTIHEESP